MSGDVALQMVSNLLWTGLLIIAPVLSVIMLVGLLISVFQVATQIQEMSLTFVPKIVAVVLVLILAGPWMLKKLVNYSSAILASIPSYL